MIPPVSLIAAAVGERARRPVRWFAIARGALLLAAMGAIIANWEDPGAGGTRLALGFFAAGLMIYCLAGLMMRRARYCPWAAGAWQLGECLMISAMMLAAPSLSGIGYLLLLFSSTRAGVCKGRGTMTFGAIIGAASCAFIFTYHGIFDGFGHLLTAGLVAVFIALPAYIASFASAMDVARGKPSAAENERIHALANVSRELRAPLNSILGMGDLLASCDLPQDACGYLAGIRSSAASLTASVQDVLDYASIELGEIKPDVVVFEPRDLILSAIQDSVAAAKARGIEITYQIAGSVPRTVSGSGPHMRQAFSLILRHAVEGQEGGTIRVHFDCRVSETGALLLCLRVTGAWSCLSDPASSQNASPNALPIGLAIAEGFAKANHSDFGIQRLPGLGTVVWIRFQCRPTPAVAAPVVVNDNADLRPASSLRILVLDANSASSAVMASVLRHAGHVVQHADTMDVGLRALFDDRVDIALVDLDAPSLDCLQLIRNLRSSELDTGRPPTPIIALTEDPGDQVRSHALAAGATGLIVRPVSMQALLRKIEGVVLHDVPQDRAAPPDDVDAYLGELYGALGSDKALERFLRHSIEDVKAALAQFNAALEGSNIPAIAASLHALSGLTANLGMQRTAKMLSLLEMRLRQKQVVSSSDPEKIKQILSRIDSGMQVVRQRYLSLLGTPAILRAS